MVEGGQLDTPNTQLHDRPLSYVVTGTPIKNYVVPLRDNRFLQ